MNDLKFTTAHDYMKRIKKTPFRNWFNHMWEEHKLEKEHHGEALDYSAAEYFAKNKKFLIKQFKKEHARGN